MDAVGSRRRRRRSGGDDGADDVLDARVGPLEGVGLGVGVVSGGGGVDDVGVVVVDGGAAAAGQMEGDVVGIKVDAGGGGGGGGGHRRRRPAAGVEIGVGVAEEAGGVTRGAGAGRLRCCRFFRNLSIS